MLSNVLQIYNNYLLVGFLKETIVGTSSYFNREEALALSQRVIGLYTLTINASAVQLNEFARHALSQLTTTFDSDLYEDFINTCGTHVITRSLVGGMIEERAKVPRCSRVYDDASFAHCIPFGDRGPISANCTYYTTQIRVISKRLLGGNVEIANENDWKRTLAVGPALLQILEMVPWYDFITNNAVKQNLITIMRYRQTNFDFIQAESARLVDSRLQPCISGAQTIISSLYKSLSIPYPILRVRWRNGAIIVLLNGKIGAASGRIAAGGNGQLKYPSDVILDKARDSLFICDRGNKRIVRWFLRNANNGETIISGVTCKGLTMDEQGFLYVSDVEKQEVRRWQVGETQGIVVAGGNGIGNRLDQLNDPRKVFVDRDHSVYVSEMVNDRVMKWVKGAREGIVVAGGRGRGSSLSQLNFPEGIIVDQLGTLYVAERGNNRIVRWPKGATEGQILVGESSAGSLQNQLFGPIGLSFDRHGNLYVADHGNHRVQKFEIQLAA
ncbi:unnamed protein product [Rotaria socialis]